MGGKSGPKANQATVALSDRKSTRLNSSHANISYAVFCLKKQNRRRPTAACLVIFRIQRLFVSATETRTHPTSALCHFPAPTPLAPFQRSEDHSSVLPRR